MPLFLAGSDRALDIMSSQISCHLIHNRHHRVLRKHRHEDFIRALHVISPCFLPSSVTSLLDDLLGFEMCVDRIQYIASRAQSAPCLTARIHPLAHSIDVHVSCGLTRHVPPKATCDLESLNRLRCEVELREHTVQLIGIVPDPLEVVPGEPTRARRRLSGRGLGLHRLRWRLSRRWDIGFRRDRGFRH